MNEEFYSIGRGSLNINGKFYYGLDYQITDFMRSLEEENQKLKEKLQQKEDVIKQLLTYLDKNKLTLNNPNILDFYINVKKILNIEKSDE